MTSRSTDELNTELKKADTLRRFLDNNQEHFQTTEFSQLLDGLIREKQLSKALLAKQAGMSDVYLHQLISGRRKPSRPRLICLCIGMGLTLEETQHLLQRSGLATLYAKSRWDAIIMYGILHKMNLFEINDLLFDEDEDTLI